MTTLVVIALGLVGLAETNIEDASAFLRQSLTLFSALNDERDSAEVLEGLAEVALHEGRYVRALCLLGAAEALRLRAGALMPSYAAKRVDKLKSLIVTVVGEEATHLAWDTSREWSYSTILTYALEADSSTPGNNS
jgi:hypothetical protein